MAGIIRAEFTDYTAFRRALQLLQENDVGKYTAYGPTNLDEDICDLMPEKSSPVRIWATIAAFIGLATFWLMCIFTSLIYEIVTGGKPPVSNVPFIVIAYEGTILFGSIGAFIAILFYARLDVRKLPENWNPSFVQTTYGIDVKPDLLHYDKAAQLLHRAEAVKVYEINNQNS